VNLSMSGSRDTRTLLFGLAAISMIVIVGRGVQVVAGWQDRSVETIHREIERRDREGLLSRQLPALRAQWRGLSELNTQLDSAEVTARNAVAAGASLMNAITDVADGAGVEISSTRLESRAEEQGAPHRTVVEIAATGSLEELVIFLSSLEAGPPAAEITNLSISRSAGTSGSGGIRTLQATVKIEALVRRPTE